MKPINCPNCDCGYQPHCCPDCGVVSPPDVDVARLARIAYDAHADRAPSSDREWQWHVDEEDKEAWRRVARAVMKAGAR